MARFSAQVYFVIFCSLAAVTSTQALDEKVTYTIKVVDINGEPAADADVAVLEESFDYADGRKRMELIEQKKTGDDGTTTLNFDFSRHNGAFIVARKESLAFTWDRLDHNALPIDGSQLTMLLDRPCVMAGIVMDHMGKPVVGARVRGEFDSSYLENEHRINAPEDWFTVATDEHGRFCFNNVPPDGTADFLVTAPRKANAYTFMASDSMPGIRYDAGRTDISIVLPPEAKVQGRVLDQAGNAVAGVRLLLRPDKTVANYYCTNRTVSEQDGRFLFENVPADVYSLQVVAPRDTMAQWVARDVKVIATEGQTTDGIILRVSEGGLLEVAVMDAVTKRPADDVSVCVLQKAGFNRYHASFWQDVRTDRNGRARFRAPLGQCQVTAGGEQYSTFEDKVVVKHRPSLMRVLLYHNPEISGTVQDQSGRALPGAAVAVVPPGHVETRADAYGRFRISWRPFGKQAFLFVRDERRNLAAVVEIKNLTRPMNMTLEPALTLAGQITDPNGLPIPVAKIQLYARPTPDFLACIGEEVITNKAGRYEIPAVSPLDKKDVYLVNVNAAGYRGLRGEQISLTRTSANRVDLSPLVMQPLNTSVSGVVVDARGRTIPNTIVSLRGPPGGQGQANRITITDSDGRFFFNRISKGSLRLQAEEARDWETGYADAQAGDKNVKIIVEQGVR